jgi:hypothetical protein
MTGPVRCLAQLSWRRRQERGGGMIFPLLEAAEGMLYRLDWQGLPSYARYCQVKSSCGGYNKCSPQTSSHKNNSRARSALYPCQQWQTLTRFAVYFKQTRFRLMYPGIYGSFFRKVVFIKAESWPPKAVSLLAISTIAMLRIVFTNLT